VLRVGSDGVTCWSRQPAASAAIFRRRPPSASLGFLLCNNPSAVSHLDGREAVCDLEQVDGSTSRAPARGSGERQGRTSGRTSKCAPTKARAAATHNKRAAQQTRSEGEYVLDGQRVSLGEKGLSENASRELVTSHHAIKPTITRRGKQQEARVNRSHVSVSSTNSSRACQ
jgi:hypothetical protein